MTVLITGAGGFLGGHLAETLRASGYAVRALVQPGEDVTALTETNADICYGDLDDRDSLERAVDRAELVLHCAAKTGPWGHYFDYHRINVEGTERLLNASLQAGVKRFIHVSSITVHGADVRGTATESSPLVSDGDPYTRTKLEAEQVLQQRIAQENASVTIVRPGMIYGPRDSHTFGRIARLIDGGRMVIIGSGRNQMPLIHVSDAARGILLASEARHAVGRTYLLVNDEPTTQLDFLSRIAEELGAATPRFHIPYRPALALAGSVETAFRIMGSKQPPPVTRFGLKQFGGENRFIVDRARHELGFVPKFGLEAGVRDSVAWFRTQALTTALH
ncbi:MAG TPA: NAD-dependent epimerase/dehydratase family protein [Acidimicrobiales bacterium]